MRKEMERIGRHLPNGIAQAIGAIREEDLENLQEIRLHAGGQVILYFGDRSMVLGFEGQVFGAPRENCPITTAGEITQTFKSLCEYSVHSYQDEIISGFITIEGGHRVGVFATAVMDGKRIASLQNISSLNIRIAREVWGAGERFYTDVFDGELRSVLIAGAPSTGKTTILRDLIRGISNGRLGRIYKVAVTDERGEICAVHGGIPQNNMGICTDIYSLCPKAVGMQMALRAGSPQLMACDEIGSDDDAQALIQSMLSGVKVIATTHADSLEQLKKRRNIAFLIDSGVFEKIVILENNGRPSVIKKIISL